MCVSLSSSVCVCHEGVCVSMPIWVGLCVCVSHQGVCVCVSSGGVFVCIFQEGVCVMRVCVCVCH